MQQLRPGAGLGARLSEPAMRRHHRAYPIYVPGELSERPRARCPVWLGWALGVVWLGVLLLGGAQLVRHLPTPQSGPSIPTEARAPLRVGGEEQQREARVRAFMVEIERSRAERTRLAEQDAEIVEAVRRARLGAR
jgi:hypothetical protein